MYTYIEYIVDNMACDLNNSAKYGQSGSLYPAQGPSAGARGTPLHQGAYLDWG